MPAPHTSPEQPNLSVHSDDVALPEVRTGKVDVEGDFHKGQDEQNTEQKTHFSFDTVAVPEYHTGKCPPWDPDCEAGKEGEKPKHRNIFSDLARTLMNGEASK